MIASTPDDMVRWYNALKAGKLISPASYRLMTTRANLNNGQAIDYGLGIGVSPINKFETVSHSGAVPGYFSWTVYFPERDLYAAGFSNNDSNHPGPAALHIAGELLGLVPKAVDINYSPGGHCPFYRPLPDSSGRLSRDQF